MSDFSQPALGANPAYDQSMDLRSLDEVQAGSTAPASYQAPQTASSYQSDGLDLRSADELAGGGVPGRMAAPQDQREHGAADFAGGVVKGFVGGAKDTVKGVALLGKGLWNTVSKPKETKAKIAEWGAYAVQHPGQTLKNTVTFPFRLAGAMVQPYSDAIRRGQPGQVVGRLGFDAALTYLTFKAGDVLKNGNSSRVTDLGDDAGTMSTGGGRVGSGAGKAGRGGTVVQTAHVGDVKVGNITNAGNGTINIHIGSNTATVNGGGGALLHTAVDNADDVAGTLSKTTKASKAAKVLSVVDDADDVVRTAGKTGGWFQNLRNQPWGGTKNISSPKSTFQSIAGGIDNGATKVVAVSTSVGTAFNKSVQWLDNGLAMLHPDNILPALKNAGNAIVRVPRFIVQNPGTSLKYAVAGVATGVHTAGVVAVNGARFVISNPGHAAVLVAATGRTAGSVLVRDEQRSSATYDPDNR